MRKEKTLLAVARYLVSAFIFLPLTALALEGTFRGVYDSQPVTASFNTLESSLTGVLTIGGERYTLLADETADGYSGQLNNVANGERLSVELKLVKERLQLKVKDGKGPMRIELDRTPNGD